MQNKNLNNIENIKILIADDDQATRMLLRAAITQWGYSSISVEDGEAAWEIMNQSDHPNICIFDWFMPKIDGVTLCKKIKNETATPAYIILLTQLTGTENIVNALNAGADEFLTKPFNHVELRCRLSVATRILNQENNHNNFANSIRKQLMDIYQKMESDNQQLRDEIHALKQAIEKDKDNAENLPILISQVSQNMEISNVKLTDNIKLIYELLNKTNSN